MYFVIETQVTAGGVGSTIVTTKADRNSAEAEYHRILQYAAVSELPKHGAMLMTDDCYPIMYQCYEHGGNDEE